MAAYQARHTDPTVLMQALEQDARAFIVLSRTFLDIAPSMLRRLQAAATSRKAEAIAFESHALKNTVALVGAKELATLLEALELSAHTNRLPPEGDLLGDVPSLYALVEDEVRDQIRYYESMGGV